MQSKRLAAFNQLSLDEQDILLALSVIYAPIRQTEFLNLLRDFDCVSGSTRNLIAKPLREKLVDLDLIDANKFGWCCKYDIADALLQKVAERPSFLNCLARMVENCHFGFHYEFNFEKKVRKLRIYLYQKNEKGFLKELDGIRATNTKHLSKVYQKFFFQNFDPHWFDQLPLSIKSRVLLDYLSMQYLKFSNFKKHYQLLNKYFQESKKTEEYFVCQHTSLNLLRGDINNIEDLLKVDDSSNAKAHMGVLRFLQDRNDEALEHFDNAIRETKKETRKRNVYFSGYIGYIYNLALFRSRSNENLQFMRKQLQFSLKQEGVSKDFYFAEQRLLKGLDVYQAKTKISAPENAVLLKYQEDTPYDLLFFALLLYWLGEIDQVINIKSPVIKKLNAFCLQAEENDYFWYAAVSSNLLDRLSTTNTKTKKIALKYSGSTFVAIIDLLPRIEHWKRALDALKNFAKPGGNEDNALKQQTKRIAWIVGLLGWRAVLLPREQRLGKNGCWSSGRPIAIKRLHNNPKQFEYLTEQDKKICSRVQIEYEEDYYSYYRKEIHHFDESAVIEAIGHPNIYWAESSSLTTPINISAAQLQLLVSEQKKHLLVKLAPYPLEKQDYIFERSATNDLLVYTVEAQCHEVAAILGEQGLLVPKQAKQQVLDSISSVASMITVQSDIGGQSSHAETVEADSRLHIHLQPIGEGIQVDIFVQPFANGGPVYKPGVGGSTVLAEIDGKQFQTTRDLVKEEKYLNQVLENCPDLYPAANAKWVMDNAEMALEALLQLQSLGDFVVLKWPQGKAIKVSRETGLQSVQFSVRKEKDWFSISGEVHVDENQVMALQNLMTLLETTSGRFLKLKDGQIIALTQELRQRLGDLKSLGDQRGNNLNFHPLAAVALSELTEGVTVKSGKHWRDQLKKLSELDNLNPQLPTTMQGELRDYQLQGYQWMVRLAYLGAGACLADDMGLGKTIQSLALILSRTADGPTLILAPTSVCNNWFEESQRFAPTLNVYYFGNGNRQQQLDDAGPFDLIVCSYGLLQAEANKLRQKKWRTIVADEAQAFKNPLTQRSKAAMALQGDFKIITTGTPIENHLGELWNLFNFINPGLLGSLKNFNERYAISIENQRDHVAQRRLKKLLQPFILRRLKNDVLTELPARTEVTIHVELSEEERVFYEALRRNAIKAIADAKNQETPAGQHHLKVLAEITKLRRACCNPRLVLPESKLSSAKLQAFEELIDELISSHHKALVFSQFVTHLTLIKELLNKKGISYQYLDGSTTMPKRKKVVSDFQSGQGDLFLISLKAGGAGLNLTAADYVVHMDPWWNPAVEDQASDRAHRLGQKRPVTIYRLVAKNTIEDKIVELHKHKRDLANRLLKDGDVSGKMSIKDILSLIEMEKDK